MPNICPDCGNEIAFRVVTLGRAVWQTPTCHIESVDEEGYRTINGRRIYNNAKHLE